MGIVPLLFHSVNVYLFLWAAGSAAFFRRPVWEQTIGKQSNERPFQTHPAVPDASGKTFRKSVRSSVNLLQPSPGVRCAGLIGETFAIVGTVLVAAGVFPDQKKCREQMQCKSHNDSERGIPQKGFPFFVSPATVR